MTCSNESTYVVQISKYLNEGCVIKGNHESFYIYFFNFFYTDEREFTHVNSVRISSRSKIGTTLDSIYGVIFVVGVRV